MERGDRDMELCIGTMPVTLLVPEARQNRT